VKTFDLVKWLSLETLPSDTKETYAQTTNHFKNMGSMTSPPSLRDLRDMRWWLKAALGHGGHSSRFVDGTLPVEAAGGE